MDKDCILKLSLLILSVIIVCSFGINTIAAASTTTSNTNPDPTIQGSSTSYATIQSAVDSAQNGDTIVLDPGTYTGSGNYNININKNLKITGQNQENTIIDAQKQGPIFNIETGFTVTIQNLTLTNGNSTTNGGAINNQGNLNLINCSITNSSTVYKPGLYGGAIENTGTLTLSDCNLNKNHATSSGGAIHNTGNLNINNSTLENNGAGYAISGMPPGGGGGSGGAISNEESGIVNINNCIIKNNHAGIVGGNTVGNGQSIRNYGILNITNSTINNNDSEDVVYTGAVANSGTLTITNCNLSHNNGVNGGAINNGGYLTITDSTLTYNHSRMGGAIYNTGSLTMTNSTLNNNTAQYGAIYNSGYLTIANSTLSNNNGGIYGGTIYNSGTLSVKGCDFESNTASRGKILYNIGSTANTIINFNRFYDLGTGYAIYDVENGFVDATLNWWGSNNDPISYIYGNVIVDPWIILKVQANPTIIKNGNTSTITADLLHDNNGNTFTGQIPNGLSVSFKTNLASLITSKSLINGIATTTLSSGNKSELVTVYAILDDQTVKTSVKIDNTTPTITATPVGGSYNDSKTVTLKMSESGTIYYTNNGTKPTINSTIYTSPIKIKTTTTLKFFAVDIAGNNSKIYSQAYTIDKTAPLVTSTSPYNLKTRTSRSGTIYIKFTENIYTSTNFSKITVKNLTTSKTTTITKSINGNILSIKNISKKSANTWYQVTIPAGAVKDKAGNKLAKAYTFRFKTGSV